MSRSFLSVLALAASTCCFASAANAQTTVVRERAVTTTPNRSLLHSGVVTLGLFYVPSVIVAVESPLTVDNHLFIPVAGPWLNYAKRDCPTCEHETLNKVMLVTDGVFQGIGALNIVGAFLFPETHVATARGKTAPAQATTLRVTPARLEGKYGVVASGTFF